MTGGNGTGRLPDGWVMRDDDDAGGWAHRERRDAIERRGPWRCPTCQGPKMHIIGMRSIGAQIRKCERCGNMDRRLPVERRKPWHLVAREPVYNPVAMAAAMLVIATVALLLGLVVFS